MMTRTMILVVSADDTGASLLASVRVPTWDRDTHFHDLMIDHDPSFLAWDAVERTRNGTLYGDLTADRLPVAS